MSEDELEQRDRNPIDMLAESLLDEIIEFVKLIPFIEKFVPLLALLVMTLPQVSALVGGMFLLCGASFLTHATATGYLNRYMAEYKGVVNGLYVAFYYGGGAVGSYLPGYVYRGFGWGGFISLLIVFLVIALLLAVRLSRTVALLRTDVDVADP